MKHSLVLSLRLSGLLLVLLLVAPAAMALHPDFSGKWKLNTAKSKLGDQFSMAPREMVIVCQENEMSVVRHSEFQEQTVTISDRYTLDGKESINEGWMGSEKKSVAVWAADGQTLSVATKIPFGESDELSVAEVYSIESGCLKIQAKAVSGWGTTEEIYIFDKQ